jgi:hypothetical protein
MGNEGEGGESTDKDGNPFSRERERTQEDLRRSPKRNKEMKIEKPSGKQQR